MACSSELIIEPSPLLYFIFTNQGNDYNRRPRTGRPCSTNDDDDVVFGGGRGDGGKCVVAAAASASAFRGHFIVLPYWPLAI